MLKKWSSKKWWELLLVILFLATWYTFVAAVVLNIDPHNAEFTLGLFALLLPLCHLIITTRSSYRSSNELPNPTVVAWAEGYPFASNIAPRVSLSL